MSHKIYFPRIQSTCEKLCLWKGHFSAFSRLFSVNNFDRGLRNQIVRSTNSLLSVTRYIRYFPRYKEKTKSRLFLIFLFFIEQHNAFLEFNLGFGPLWVSIEGKLQVVYCFIVINLFSTINLFLFCALLIGLSTNNLNQEYFN